MLNVEFRLDFIDFVWYGGRITDIVETPPSIRKFCNKKNKCGVSTKLN